MTKTVSSYYIEGIKEAREVFSQHGYLCPDNEYKTFKKLAANHSGVMKDFFKGQADFWKNRAKQ